MPHPIPSVDAVVPSGGSLHSLHWGLLASLQRYAETHLPTTTSAEIMEIVTPG